MTASTRIRGGILALSGVLLVAGCTDTASSSDSAARAREPSRSSANPTVVSPTIPSEKSIVASGYSAVCQGRGFLDAAEYAGPGPHLIAVSAKATPGSAPEAEAALSEAVDDDIVQLPSEWESDSNTSLQLVACVDVIAVQKVRDCAYQVIGTTLGARDITAGLFERALRVEVRSTRSGAVVAPAVEVTTNTAVCAGSVAQPSDGSAVAPHQYGALSDAQRDTLFAPLVMATV